MGVTADVGDNLFASCAFGEILDDNGPERNFDGLVGRVGGDAPIEVGNFSEIDSDWEGISLTKFSGNKPRAPISQNVLAYLRQVLIIN